MIKKSRTEYKDKVEKRLSDMTRGRHSNICRVMPIITIKIMIISQRL